MLNKKIVWALVLGWLSLSAVSKGAETLPALTDGKAPVSVEETWAGFDPRKEPLDVEVLKEWEEDGVIVQVLRLRVGIFKGQKAMLAAVYGYPKGAKNLPGLVQIHGGGQSAQSSFVVKDAKNGYATISIAWAGRINSTHYKVTNKEKEAFWTGNTENPDYRLTTDWGAVDAYHHHCRFKGNNFVQNPPSESTVDSIQSPRNSGWFLATLGARRAITFLEQQPQVNPDKIGVYGMSMGGKLTVLTTGADSRVKASAPACGGITDLSTRGRTLPGVADDSYLERIACPTIFMVPSNDFHSQVQDIPAAVDALKTTDWRVVSSPNRNHGDRSEYSVGTLLWFDQHLKGTFEMAQTPEVLVSLESASKIPVVSVTPDRSQKIRSLDVYYTQDGDKKAADKFWHLAKTVKKGGATTFELPLSSTDKPLWVYADVEYDLGRTVEAVGYSGEKVKTDSYHLASVVTMIDAQTLRESEIIATVDGSKPAENFEEFTPNRGLEKLFPMFTFEDGISCVVDPLGRNGMSIEIKDSPDFQQAWQPLFNLNPNRIPFLGTSKWAMSFDLMLDPESPIPVTLEFRTKGAKKRFSPISVDAKGNVVARGQGSVSLGKVGLGQWWTVSVTYDLNNAQTYQVKINDVHGTVLAQQAIPIPADMGAVNWIGFIPHGTQDGRLYIDNVKLEQMKARSVAEASDDASLIQNGSFETPVIQSQFETYQANSNALNGWKVSGKGVVLINGFDNFGKWNVPSKAASGSHFLQLQTHIGGAGTVSQAFATTAGQTYTLTFDYSGIFPVNKSTSLKYKVSGTDPRTVQLNISGNQLPWQTESFDFVATAGTTTLSFTGKMVGGFWGASIDNVRVEAKK